MLTIYLAGVLIVFVLMVIRIISSISISFSLRARNMKKVGLYYHFVMGNFSKDKPNTFNLILGIFTMIVIEPLLSWINVVITIWKYISIYANKSPVPEYLKEYQFKLSHFNLTKEEIERMGRELAKKQGLEIVDEVDDDNVITENSNGFVNEYTVYPSKMEYHYHYHTPDYDCQSDAIFKYQIEGVKVKSKLIEGYNSSLFNRKIEREYEVKDNVVLESNIREKEKNNKNIDRKIQELKSQTEWNDLWYYKLTYLILSKHSEIISNEEFRKYLRQEIERIRTGVQKIIKLSEDNGFIVKHFEIGGLSPDIPDNLSKEQADIFEKRYKEIFSKDLYLQQGLSEYEFNNSRDIEAYILDLLGEQVIKA